MRLINADALKRNFPKDEDWQYPVNTNEYVCGCIDAQPTVDAIPVIWLMKLSVTAQSDEACEMINEIIARWKEKKK